MAQAGADTRGRSASGRASAYWSTPTGGELRSSVIEPPGPGYAEVRTLHTGISRGSERLVHRGQVPPAVADVMRAPFQEGDFGEASVYHYPEIKPAYSVWGGYGFADANGSRRAVEGVNRYGVPG